MHAAAAVSAVSRACRAGAATCLWGEHASIGQSTRALQTLSSQSSRSVIASLTNSVVSCWVAHRHGRALSQSAPALGRTTNHAAKSTLMNGTLSMHRVQARDRVHACLRCPHNAAGTDQHAHWNAWEETCCNCEFTDISVSLLSPRALPCAKEELCNA